LRNRILNKRVQVFKLAINANIYCFVTISGFFVTRQCIFAFIASLKTWVSKPERCILIIFLLVYSILSKLSETDYIICTSVKFSQKEWAKNRRLCHFISHGVITCIKIKLETKNLYNIYIFIIFQYYSLDAHVSSKHITKYVFIMSYLVS